MSRAKGWKKMLGLALEVPQDILLDLPRVSIIGGQQLLVENHQGILQFTGELLRLRISFGELRVEGKGLVIRQILPQEIFFDSERIDAVQYIREQK